MNELVWHDLECGGYLADLPLWRELAQRTGDPVLEIGSGAGRVTLDLAAAGHQVTALDHDPALLAALIGRARGLPVTVVLADAEDFHLGRRFALCIVPMQTIQLLPGARGRSGFLASAAEHLIPGGLLAAAIADPLEAFNADATEPPLPDVAEHDGVIYWSQPVAVREEPDAVVIERIRQVSLPDGERTAKSDAVRLYRLSAEQLEHEAAAFGLQPHERHRVEPTHEYVGSEVVVVHA